MRGGGREERSDRLFALSHILATFRFPSLPHPSTSPKTIGPILKAQVRRPSHPASKPALIPRLCATTTQAVAFLTKKLLESRLFVAGVEHAHRTISEIQEGAYQTLRQATGTSHLHLRRAAIGLLTRLSEPAEEGETPPKTVHARRREDVPLRRKAQEVPRSRPVEEERQQALERVDPNAELKQFLERMRKDLEEQQGKK